MITANAGDSRAVMCRKGQALELSYDHKPAAETEKKRIEAAGGRLEELRAARKGGASMKKQVKHHLKSI